ncbi:hypothetical protein Pmani_021701 [Petrolisthes manimaculis]|uniref:Uncharacterized protein n=1 Tax=Petrolisthes manimaculis TaxID=1843537 RepID=A0AAE1PFW9_9EUCA|nr:hypothetical protein Pmani_021701 [Petrolisthes manimaculis]
MLLWSRVLTLAVVVTVVLLVVVHPALAHRRYNHRKRYSYPRPRISVSSDCIVLHTSEEEIRPLGTVVPPCRRFCCYFLNSYNECELDKPCLGGLD